jgi:hypothetical protein
MTTTVDDDSAKGLAAMTLATLSRTRAPLIIPKSPARSRVLAATAELQRAVDQLFEEAKAQAREKAKRDEENERKAQARLARAATKEYRVEVSKRWLEELASDALDALNAQANQAQANGQRAFANQLSDRIDHLIADLQRLGLMERPKGSKS